MNQYFVEFIGTMIFTYVILATGNPLAIGATFALIKLLTQNLTAGYLNPAITITLASAGVIPTTDILFYCVVQVFGALVALEIFKRYKI
jgi:glycerol uptake facilitator-like aquaporin